jgi:hypothetical protein
MTKILAIANQKGGRREPPGERPRKRGSTVRRIGGGHPEAQ